MPLTYHTTKLPGMAWAVTDANGKRWCVCDREADAERIAYCLRIVEESEESDRKAQGDFINREAEKLEREWGRR